MSRTKLPEQVQFQWSAVVVAAQAGTQSGGPCASIPAWGAAGMTRRSIKGSTFRAFTIVELLVSVVIIMILITAALYALRGGGKAAKRAESLNTLRQIMTAYTGYSNEHKGRLLPGYVDPGMIGTNPNQLNLKANLVGTDETLSAADTAPYVFRLAPYLDGDWRAFMTDYRSPAQESRFTAEYSCGRYACPAPAAAGIFNNIARFPSFGLNSIYLGGDSFHGDDNLDPWIVQASGITPNPDSIAATRLSQVKNPGKIVVFAPNDAWNVAGMPVNDVTFTFGYCELRPPFAAFDAATQVGSQPQWAIDITPSSPTNGQALPIFGNEGGIPFDRLGDDRIAVSHLDGSVDTELLGRLEKDMSRWSPFALSNN